MPASLLSFPQALPIQPLPTSFLQWQVSLRLRTMLEEGGAPHAGVAPLLTVRAPQAPVGSITYSIICGVLPAPDALAAKTAEFKALYDENIEQGARHVYDRGLEYLKSYYQQPLSAFDPDTITTLMNEDSPLVAALEKDPRASLTFYVFNLRSREELDKLRCHHLECQVEIHKNGPVYDNVWWHNTLFHGKADNMVVLRCRHLRSYDTRFGRREEIV